MHCIAIRRSYHSLDGVRERSKWASFRYLEPNSVFGGKSNLYLTNRDNSLFGVTFRFPRTVSAVASYLVNVLTV